MVQLQQVLDSMRAHQNDSFVQTAGCQALQAMVAVKANASPLWKDRGQAVASSVLLAMRAHPGSAVLQHEACKLVLALSAQVEGMPATMGKEGGVQDVLATLRDNSDTPDIATTCCHALWSLCVSGQ